MSAIERLKAWRDAWIIGPEFDADVIEIMQQHQEMLEALHAVESEIALGGYLQEVVAAAIAKAESRT